MGGADPGCLKGYAIFVGVVFLPVSIAGIGFSVFLLFGEPFASQTNHTYRPNWEDIGPLIIVSITNLVINIALIGGAKQCSRKIIQVWIVWEYLMILLFWMWYGYNMLKYHGYIDWSDYGMRTCYWCSQKNVREMMGYVGALASFVLIVSMIPVHMLQSKLNKQHRYLTQSQYELEESQYGGSQNQYSSHHQYEQSQYYPQQYHSYGQHQHHQQAPNQYNYSHQY